MQEQNEYQHLIARIDRLETREMIATSVFRATRRHYHDLAKRALNIYLSSTSLERKKYAAAIYRKYRYILKAQDRLELTIIDEQQKISGVGPVR